MTTTQTVYVLMEESHEGLSIDGVYSTMELAQAAAERDARALASMRLGQFGWTDREMQSFRNAAESSWTFSWDKCSDESWQASCDSFSFDSLFQYLPVIGVFEVITE